MTERQQMLIRKTDQERERVLSAERWLWTHPQTGYHEWEANKYMTDAFEQMGYTLTRADRDARFSPIPGFYTDIDTGRNGPCLCIMSELDALDIANHPESVNGCAHACGHNAQGAAMLGLAAVLRDEEVLKPLCGKIRLMVVPAEEMIQLAEREKMRQAGDIAFFGGKTEFMRRGYFNGVDMAMMVHTESDDQHDFSCDASSNGCMAKVFTYYGKAAHAGGEPWNGSNAEYAMMLGLQACNNLRETFHDEETIRFHPIIHGVQSAVNIIPNQITGESYVRGKTIEAILRENQKINQALAGAAVSMNCRLHLSDRAGYAPKVYDTLMMEISEQCCKLLTDANRVDFDSTRHGTTSSDFGDVTCVMPGIQFYASGAVGKGHGTDYYIADPDKACMNSAKAQLLIADRLLSGQAEMAQKVISGHKPLYPSVEAFLKELERFYLEADAVQYQANGEAVLKWN